MSRIWILGYVVCGLMIPLLVFVGLIVVAEAQYLQQRLQLRTPAQDKRDWNHLHTGRWLVADAAQDRHWIIQKGLVQFENGCATFHDEDGNRWILPLSPAITIIEMKGQNFPNFIRKHGYKLGVNFPMTSVPTLGHESLHEQPEEQP